MTNINKEVGKKIREYRTRRGWTQGDLAFEATLHRAYIGQIERGEKNIGLRNLKKIADALGVEVENLVRS